MRAGIFIALGVLLSRGAAADDPRPAPVRTEPRLSREDAELVKELAVLEQLELLRNLELFEGDEAPPPERSSPPRDNK